MSKQFKEVLELSEEMTSKLVEKLGCGGFDGGCVVVAHALKKVYGGEIVVLVDKSNNAQHAAILKSRTLIDLDGPDSPNEFIKRFNANEHAKCYTYRKIRVNDLPDAHRSRKVIEELAALLNKKRHSQGMSF